MMTDTMARFQGLETVADEHVRELGEKFLDLGWSREVGSRAEGRLRGQRGVENNRLRALLMHNLTSFDVERRSKGSKKSAPRRGTDTGAS